MPISSKLPTLLTLLLLLASAGFLQAEKGVWKADPDYGKFNILPWPKGDATYKSPDAYFAIAKDAVRKKFGEKLHLENVEDYQASLRHYPALPVPDQNVVAVLLDRRVTWLELNYHRLDSRVVMVVLIRPDLKKINIYSVKTTIEEMFR